MAEEDLQTRKDDTNSREEIGQYLKRVREEKGISLRTVAEETKIRVRYLKALEEGDYGTLPGAVYANGFLRNYARFLGVELPRHESIIPPKARGEVPEQQAVVIKPTRRPRRRSGWRVILLLLLAGIMAIYAFSSLPNLQGPGEPEPEDIGGLNGGIPGEEGDVGEEGGEIGQEGEPEEEEGSTGTVNLVQDTDRLGEYLVSEGPITLRVRVENSPCWLRVIADGMAVEETLQPGDERDYTATGELRIRAGNPGSLFLKVNEHALGQAGKPGIPKDIIFNWE